MHSVVSDLSGDRKRLAGRLMQVGIAAILAVGLLARNVSVVVNASVCLAATFLPALLRRDHSIHLAPGLTLWLTGALLLHAAGMLGLYDSVAWWDGLTHTLSATIVAGVGYVTARAVDRHAPGVTLPPRFLFVYVLLFTLALGVLWEVLEFGARALATALSLDPVLVQYGLEDTVLDLVFDGVGAVLVALFGTRDLAGPVEALTARLDRTGE